jgi:hypothetical protein
MRGVRARFGSAIDRRWEMLIPMTLLCVAACGGCSDDGLDDSGGGMPSLPPPPPTVTSSQTTHEGTEPGLCLAWTSQVVDLSSLGTVDGNDNVMSFYFHGVSGGFSVATAPGGESTPAHLAAIAIDGTGNPRGGGAVDIPVESGALSDLMGTPDGGFLAVWTQADNDERPIDMYLKRYDPSGAPLGFSQAVSGGYGYLGADGEAVDVAYEAPDAMTELVGSASLDGTSLTAGATLSGGGYQQVVEWNHGVVTSSVGYGGAVLKSTHAGATLTSITLPAPLNDSDIYSGALGVTVQVASGNADATVLVAQSGSVTFLDPDKALVVSTDMVVNGSAVCRVPSADGVDRAALGWISNVPSASGGADTLQIAEVSRTGVRSPIGQAALPPAMRDLVPSAEDMEVRIASTYEGDAYMVVLVSRTTIEGAVFRCQERAQ